MRALCRRGIGLQCSRQLDIKPFLEVTTSIWNGASHKLCFYASKPNPDFPFLGSGHCSSPGSGQKFRGIILWEVTCRIILAPSRGLAQSILHFLVPEDKPEKSQVAAFLQLPYPIPLSLSQIQQQTSPSVPRSPGRSDNRTSPSSRWKKGENCWVEAHLDRFMLVSTGYKGANILVDPMAELRWQILEWPSISPGQACPLSFKGSPYWMAPEIIKNTSGSNLAVDIWSLGCTGNWTFQESANKGFR
ncbi:hypothetical protein OSB04_un001582 [Centaurea solstitialis]|uniref:Uncharacterized protein n=1 Tax=Centaurea solstitialis TaxID=347529 RepID=A0AA38SNG8_9ASTR|nr:hypothetical protein OSB04_un001582 [Centaurea solstitialis]